MCSQNRGRVGSESSTPATAAEPQPMSWTLNGKYFFCRHLYRSGRCSCQIGQTPEKRSSDVFHYCHLARLKTIHSRLRCCTEHCHRLSHDRRLPYTCCGRVPLMWGHLLVWLTLRVMHSHGRGGAAFLEQSASLPKYFHLSRGSLFSVLLSFRRNLGNRRIRTPWSSLDWSPSLFMTSRRPSQK